MTLTTALLAIFAGGALGLVIAYSQYRSKAARLHRDFTKKAAKLGVFVPPKW